MPMRRSSQAAGWIDVTRPIGPGLPIYPGDPPPVLATERRDGTQIVYLSLTTHTGTHLDLPRHVLPAGRRPTDREILGALNGPAVVIHLPGLCGKAIPLDLLRHALGGARRPPSRLLLRTDPRGSSVWSGLDADAAAWLAGRAALVGTDALSIDPPGERLDAHRILLRAGTLIVENLHLAAVKASRYTMWSLPIKLQTSDGAPLRVLLGKSKSKNTSERPERSQEDGGTR
ncbi:MAG: cyclase family protein [Candidatus Eisenbacteria bacterium]|nr:cyclase family protein [Candidatus Eisenbacteria bacterium]